MIKKEFDSNIDLVIYSLASPRRTDPNSGHTYNSTLKPIGKPFTEKTVNTMTRKVSNISIQAASTEEIDNTIKVMGGEDWEYWIEALLEANVLANGVQVVAYSYIGPEITNPIYRHGTIGKAKEHLEKSAVSINNKLAKVKGRALISVNKAVVTQASSAIPVVPLYAAILYKVMKEKNSHEGCIEQIYRLFADFLYSAAPINLDDNNFIRIDDREMQKDVQEAVKEIWKQVNSDNLEDISDIKSYQDEFYRLFGFGLDSVDYQAEVEPQIDIDSISIIESSTRIN